MRSANLAEAIILQAMDDLYEEGERSGSVEFFTGEGFAECASLAGMDHDAMMGVLEVVSALVSGPIREGFRDICLSGDHAQLRPGRGARIQGIH